MERRKVKFFVSIPVAILGATGVVGQKVIALLQQRPHLRINEVVASSARAGQFFGEVCDWREGLCPLPSTVGSMILCTLDNVCSPLVLSCLPAQVAKEVEPLLAAQGKLVFSNASAFRMESDVPLLIPEINKNHLSCLKRQPYAGKMITNPNCSAVGVALALAPLLSLATVKHVSVVTLQSVSGAGYPGVASLDMLSNTIPHIPEECEKIAAEVKKILGGQDCPWSCPMTVSVHRVPVCVGHVATLHITFAHNVTPTQAKKAYQQWNEYYPNLFILHSLPGRPQSVRDLTPQDMRVHIGHLNSGGTSSILTLVVLTHNLVRGAAGALLANVDCYFADRSNLCNGEEENIGLGFKKLSLIHSG